MAGLPVFFDIQFFDSSVSPHVVAASYQLFTYDSGTTTNKTTWTDEAGAVPNANPIILDSAGRCALFLSNTGQYSFELRKPVAQGGGLVKRWDDVGSSQSLTPNSLNSVSGTNSITASFDSLTAITAYVTGQIYTFIATATNTGPMTINIGGLGVKNILGAGGLALQAGDVLVGDMVAIAYDGAAFRIVSASALLQSGSGAVPRSLNEQLRETVWVTQFMSPTQKTDYYSRAATLDLTVAIQAAIDSTSSNPVDVVFPPGKGKITGRINVTKDGVRLRGSGRYVTELVFQNLAQDCFYVRGTAILTQVYGFELSDMSILQSGKTAGRWFRGEFIADSTLKNLHVEDPYNGFDILNSNNITLENVKIEGNLGGAGTYMGRWRGGIAGATDTDPMTQNGTDRSDVLVMKDVFCNGKYSGCDGFLWDGYAHTLNSLHTSFVGSNYGIRIRNTAASTQYFPQFGEFTTFTVDGAKTRAAQFAAGRNMQFINVHLSNQTGGAGQGNADQYAMTLDEDAAASETSAWAFVNGRIGDCRNEAAFVNAMDVEFSNIRFQNGGRQTTNTYSALHIGSAAQDITVDGCKSNQFGTNQDWRHGVQVDAGAVRIVVTNNNFYNALTKGILWLSNDSNSVDAYNLWHTPSKQTIYQGGPLTVPASVTSANGITIAATDMMGGILILTGGAGANYSVTTDTAVNLLLACESPMIGKTIPLMLINTSAFQCTFQPGSGVTMSGVTTSGNFIIGGNSVRLLHVRAANVGSGTEAFVIYG